MREVRTHLRKCRTRRVAESSPPPGPFISTHEELGIPPRKGQKFGHMVYWSSVYPFLGGIAGIGSTE